VQRTTPFSTEYLKIFVTATNVSTINFTNMMLSDVVQALRQNYTAENYDFYL